MLTLNSGDPTAVAIIEAIQTGDLQSLQWLLAEKPDLARARIKNAKGAMRTPLHIATDWPGYFPNGPAVVTALIAAGGDPNARMMGPHSSETPLQWAASSDDVDVAEALITGGADLEMAGASIAGGTALDNAIGYACWQVARLLVAHGAKVEKLWHAAALGMIPAIEKFIAAPDQPTSIELNNAFWHACSGGKRRAAEYLLARGADVNWIPDYAKQSPLDIACSLDTGRQALVTWLRSRGVRSDSTS